MKIALLQTLSLSLSLPNTLARAHAFRYARNYSARTRVYALLFESSAFEVVKSKPPPSVLDGGFDRLKLFSCARLDACTRRLSLIEMTREIDKDQVVVSDNFR